MKLDVRDFDLSRLVPTNRDETTWLANWPNPLSCYCADNSHVTQALYAINVLGLYGKRIYFSRLMQLLLPRTLVFSAGRVFCKLVHMTYVSSDQICI